MNTRSLAYYAAFISTASLIILGGAWERYLAPLHPGGSLLSLKVLPLLPILWGMFKGHKKAFQWAVLIIWLYVGEALTRLKTDQGMSQQCAGYALVLALSVFASSTCWLRLYYKQASTH